ncbi:protein NARROW LEAF 1-like isoform X1 [Vicia villosa]|uniref:protein NARROW LEAF 1-like isoform X1 n=1 Tax=Vicia villosa TaxID=3911 RepID=UPI00273C1ACB|nr:protein NARROW LEAF 1-like isoform X1 [Vicia villosa]XP_058730641.1 protein NARROW LEAF 1-like isoform X1 [Vicia villosa]
MNRNRLDLRVVHHSGSTQSEESSLDLERNYYGHRNPSSSPVQLQTFAVGVQHSESNAAYFSWPTLSRWNDAAEDRANYFGNLQKGVLPETLGRLPTGQQATTLLELMTIRAFHSKILRRFSLGTAIGFRIRGGVLTDIPAILVFVAHKVHRQWLNHVQCLPAALEGPGGVWCDVDVVEFSYYGAPAQTPKEQLYTELADGLRGSDSCVGSGSQVASQETYGTLGAIVRSRTGSREVGFLTNRHVAVDLDYPNQKMFHPLPPSLGPGVYLGAVERATSFITDDLWYGIFAGTNPETFVRADGAFIPFAEDFNMNNVITSIRGVGDIGEVHVIDLQSPINSLIGRQVIKVGRSSGLTTGTIMAYALEYNDEKGICFLTDFLVVGENQQTFDLEGDSGSLILLTGQNREKPRPVGIIWGGTANRGRLKLRVGQPPENWTSGVDLGRLLDLLELDLVTTNEALQAAAHEHKNGSTVGIGSSNGESSPTVPIKEKIEESFEPFCLNMQQVPVEEEPSKIVKPSLRPCEFHIKNEIETVPNVEHQFIPTSYAGKSPVHQSYLKEDSEFKSLSELKNEPEEDNFVSLHLGEPEAKRRKHSSSPLSSKN